MSLTKEQEKDLANLTKAAEDGTLILENMQRMAFLTAVKSGWHDPGVEADSFGVFLTHVHAELSEAWEAYRINGDEKRTWYTEPIATLEVDGESIISRKPEGSWTEIADAIIRIIHRAEYQGVDLKNLILNKMLYNLTRSYKHGGKHT